MIVLFTDFGINGPYVGQMKAVLFQQAPGVSVVDLFADAPAFEPQLSAYLLAAYVNEFPQGSVFLCVVDPGVGNQSRRPVIVKVDERWFVGPDNGLFNVICTRAKNPKAIQWWQITWQPPKLSSSFHGRDLFAPVAARLASAEMPACKDLDRRFPGRSSALPCRPQQTTLACPGTGAQCHINRKRAHGNLGQDVFRSAARCGVLV